MEDALSSSQPSLLATRRGTNMKQNRTLFSQKFSVNKILSLRKAPNSGQASSFQCCATLHFDILN